MNNKRFAINQFVLHFGGVLSGILAGLASSSLAPFPGAAQPTARPAFQPNLSPNLVNEPIPLTSPLSSQPWLLLYPQHPGYRQAVEQASENSAKSNQTVPKSAQPFATNQPAAQTLPKSQPPQLAITNPQPNLNSTIAPGSSKQDLPQTQASTTNPAPLFIQPIEPPDPALQRRRPRFYPGFNAGSPSGFGANWGDVFAGISLINRSSPIGSATDKADGSIAIGAGFGNSQDLLGFEAVYNLISLTPSRFASNGSFDFKVHRALPDLMSFAVGWENAINYGPDAGGTASSVYGSFSKFFVLQPDTIENPMLLGLTLGTGGGRFRSFNDQVAGNGGVGIFASAGLQVLANLSVITDWTGQNLNLGVSYVPFASLPIYVNGTLVDVAGNTNIGLRYSLGIGFGFNFR